MNDPIPLRGKAQTAGGSGGNGDVRERLARLEQKVDDMKEHLPTKADLESVKTLISEKESTQLRWLIGILLTAGLVLVVTMARLFLE